MLSYEIDYKNIINLEKYEGGPFAELLSASEAAQIWDLDPSAIRKAISDGRMREGQDCRKFGKQWVISVEAMCRIYGNDFWKHYVFQMEMLYHPY